jgi:hypothetical protein
MTTRYFDPYRRNYRSLSVKDLLDARESRHVQLMAMDNVIGTAIGLYRIHHQSPDNKNDNTAAAAVTRGQYSTPRTFQNSSVKSWSWPCVLVIVRRWMSPREFKAKPDQVVRPFFDLPDGRVVPVCVVCASLYEGDASQVVSVPVISSGLGGGFPVFTTVQGEEHVGTVACIVHDSQRHFALTAQHVVGAPGSEISTLVDGSYERIGAAAESRITTQPFEHVFPGLPGPSSSSNLDVGLIEMDSLAKWSSDVRGIGRIGPLVDFNTNSASLDWIGRGVLGYGSSTGRMTGEITALFYRYRTVGGIDYVSDFLISDRKGRPLKSQPGDSGTLLCIDPSEFERGPNDEPALPGPFAVQWGGQKIVSGPDSVVTQFVLATSLATACRELNVELVTDWRNDVTEYWGQVGHFKIAEQAVKLTPGSLGTFMQAQRQLITFPGIAAPRKLDPSKDFVPLADVPDIVWKNNINKTGVGVRSGAENPNHYADIDLPYKAATLGDLGPDAGAWLTAYKSKSVIWQHQGLLPFRIWQIFDEMVGYVKSGDALRFFCAAGVLSHYVGDSCQPLHGSQHADGLNGSTTGVHTTYEERMVDDNAAALATLVDVQLKKAFKPRLVKSGKEAATRVLALMHQCQKLIPPADLCKLYNQNHTGGIKSGGDPVAAKALFKVYGQKTAVCIANGSKLLATLWISAFTAGGGTDSTLSKPVTNALVRSVYADEGDTFVPSYTLGQWIDNVTGI